MRILLEDLLRDYSPAYGDNWEHAFEIANEDVEVITEITHEYKRDRRFRDPILLSTPEAENQTILDGMHRITTLHNLGETHAYVRFGYDESVFKRQINIDLYYEGIETEEARERIWDHTDLNTSWPLVSNFQDAERPHSKRLQECWVNIDFIGTFMSGTTMTVDTIIPLTENDSRYWEIISWKVRERFTLPGAKMPRLEAKLYDYGDDIEHAEPLEVLEMG